ncbi:hypothetical protein R50072_24670 [Simiduia litorea]|uniref:hypothetical protein n=1 Tax=Simiduia litorea TaxID=1435348 RepID=UPI0036F3129E
MMRLSLLCLSLSAIGLMPAAIADTEVDVKPQILAKVVEREFLYSFGLSNPGTLGVDRVRYELEIVDAWNDNLVLAKGQRISVITPGGCDRLLKADERYLLPMHLVSSVSESEAHSEAALPAAQWQSDCTVATEDAAKKTIARLNQQRQAHSPELHLSAN